MKKSIEKRIEELEKRLGPKKKKGPMPIFTQHVRDETPGEFQARLRALGVTEGSPIFITGRPGDHLFNEEEIKENAECDAGLKELEKSGDTEGALIIRVVHVKKPGPGER